MSYREMRGQLSPALRGVLDEFKHDNLGTGKGGPRFSLFEKWTRRRQGVLFPEADLHWVLMEFSRAASHARGYWQQYDNRVRDYILQHGDNVTVARINSWASSVSSSSIAMTSRQRQSHRGQQSCQHLPAIAEAGAVPSDDDDDENEQPTLEEGHDWKQGERLGEAKDPGPARGMRNQLTSSRRMGWGAGRGASRGVPAASGVGRGVPAVCGVGRGASREVPAASGVGRGASRGVSAASGLSRGASRGMPAVSGLGRGASRGVSAVSGLSRGASRGVSAVSGLGRGASRGVPAAREVGRGASRSVPADYCCGGVCQPCMRRMGVACERLSVSGAWNHGGSRQPGQRLRGSRFSSHLSTMRGARPVIPLCSKPQVTPSNLYYAGGRFFCASLELYTL